MDTQNEETRLELGWKLPPCWRACIGPESAVQVVEGEKATMVSPNCEPCKLQCQSDKQDMLLGTVSVMIATGVKQLLLDQS